MGPHRHLPQAVRNFNAGLASGEWLFGLMGMDQYPLAQHRAIRPHHLPFVGTMIPAGIGMADHHMKIIAAVCSPLMLNRDDISLPGKAGAAARQCRIAWKSGFMTQSCSCLLQSRVTIVSGRRVRADQVDLGRSDRITGLRVRRAWSACRGFGPIPDPTKISHNPRFRRPPAPRGRLRQDARPSRRI